MAEDDKKQAPSRQGGLGALGVLWNYGLARVVPGAGVKRLISAIDSPNEDAAMAAYMALVKLGPKYAETLVEAARGGACTPGLLQVLGDLGEPAVIPALEEFAQSSDPEIAAAARESIAALREEDQDKL